MSMLLSLLLALHIIAAVIWVGGLFFSFIALRPALDSRSEPLKFELWVAILKKFFPWVWVCIVTLLATGFAMISLMGGLSSAPTPVLVMMAMGIIMMAIFKFTYIAPFKHLIRGCDENAPEVARYALKTIRLSVLANLILGILTIAIATLNRF